MSPKILFAATGRVAFALLPLVAVACGGDAPTSGDEPDATDVRGDSEPDATDDTDARDSHDSAPLIPDALPIDGPRVIHTRSAENPLSAPFPADDLWPTGAPLDLSRWPGRDNATVDQALSLLERDARGFSQTAALFFPFDRPLSEEQATALTVTPEASLADDAPIVLLALPTPGDPVARRVPFRARYRDDLGPYGAVDTLTVLPLAGTPMAPGQRHVAVVRRLVGSGHPLGRDVALSALLAGAPPAALASLSDALPLALDTTGIAADDVAGATTFVTDDAAGRTLAFIDAARTTAPRGLADWTLDDVYDDYCVFRSEVELPTFQHGTPPFQSGADPGGAWLTDAAGAPLQAGWETSRLFATVPRREQPDAGWPHVVFIRTGAGGDRALADRGVRDGEGVAEPGTGPAAAFATSGWAGLTWDGPHGGVRNVSGGDEQFLMFNVENAQAMRDNVRQSALEATWIATLADGLTIDGSACPGAAERVTFDPGRRALWGHSMGATIAPLALAADRSFRVALLSGAGGSYIHNIVLKQLPIETRPIAELMLGYFPARDLETDDPALSLLQWAIEAADPPLYAAAAADQRDVLMMQGIVDRYILPPIASATSVSMGLDLVGPARDTDVQEIAQFPTALALLRLTGAGEHLERGACANRGAHTRALLQFAEDGVEDGHEVAYQRSEARAAYTCFLSTSLDGAPVAMGGDGRCVCPE